MELLGILNELFLACFSSYTQIICISVEPFLGLMLSGFTYYISAYLGLTFNIETFYVNPFMSFLFIGIYIIGKFMLCMSNSRKIAMILYVQLGRLITYIYLAYCSINNLYILNYICLKHEDTLSSLSGGALPYVVFILVILYAAVSTAIAIGISNLVSKTMLGMQALQLHISFIPFTSFFYEMFVMFMVAGLFLIRTFFPTLSIGVNIGFIIICILLLKISSRSLDFFYNIYAKPFYGDLFPAFKKTKPFMAKIPKKILKSANMDTNEGVVCAFAIIIDKNKMPDIPRYAKIFGTIKDDEIKLSRIGFYTRKVMDVVYPKVDLYYTISNHYLEIFTMTGDINNINHLFKKPKKSCSFAIPRCYEDKYDLIIEKLKATNLDSLKNQEDKYGSY